MQKKDELSYSGSTLNKADMVEPLFILRAQDVLAPDVVRAWVEAAEAAGVSKEKCAEALDCADAMEAWHARKVPD